MQFSYYAKKNSGEEKRGTAEARDRLELARALRKDDYILISCKEKNQRRFSSFDFLKFFGGVSSSDKVIFTKNLGVMISAGLSLVRALEIMSRQTKNKKFQKILLSLMENVQKGNLLSESMKNYPNVFSSLFTAMVKVGEESGKLSESLRLVGEQLENDRVLVKKIKGAMIYPLIIVIAMILIGILMLIYVVPTLVSTFRELNIQLPLSTRVIIFVSDFLNKNIIASLFIMLFFISAVVFPARTERGKRIFNNLLLHIPVISLIVKKINAARTSRTMSSLIASGVNVIEALSITKDVLQNYRYKEVLEKAKIDVQKGSPISDSFKKADNLYPSLVGEVIAVGEETGKISEMLSRLAVFYEGEVEEATKDLSVVIEPVLMIFIGAVVGFFAISMIKPMYSMMGGL